ncbi:MAG: hypothetical protein JRH20_14060 [Deltaproteobacteria bacterium]|nr:hypothetical protein [Deltaproteobacteria bacterium]
MSLALILLTSCSFDASGPAGLAPTKPDLGPVGDKSVPTLDVENFCAAQPCPFGCDSEEKRCLRLLPSNFDPRPLYDQATTDLVLSSSDQVLIDTTSGTIEVGGEFLQQSMPLITQLGVEGYRARLLALNSLTITADTVVKVTGSHPLILYARDSITIMGLLDASADGVVPGPGGRQGGVGDSDVELDHGEICGWGSRTGGEGNGGKLMKAFSTDLTTDGGGGGGGWGSRGASGGPGGPCTFGFIVVTVAGAGGGGDAVGNDENYALSPLLGGCGAGAGGGPDPGTALVADPIRLGGNGGGGGGALQLSAGTRITMAATAIITVGGGGGEPGGDLAGGGGGGSGGSILMEAPTLDINGVLAANGGGGGAGGSALQDVRAAGGEDGGSSNVAANGGTIPPGIVFGGYGGDGAAADGDAHVGFGGPGVCNAGGGGGGVGSIVLISSTVPANVPASPTPTLLFQLQTW